MFDSVPSVEYKRLEEDKAGEQTDSLEDLTVSLNEKQNTAPVTNDSKDISAAKENLFEYIDEDPFSVAGTESGPVERVLEPPPRQGSRDSRRRDLCDACLDAGHLDEVNGAALAFVRQQSEGGKSTGRNTEEEPEVKQLTLESLALEHNGRLKTLEDPETDQVSKKSFDITKNEIPEPKESAEKSVVRKPLVRQRSELGDREEGAKTNNQTSFHQTDEPDQTKQETCSTDRDGQEAGGDKEREDPPNEISSKMSVTSLASGESGPTLSFSVDSLGWCGGIVLSSIIISHPNGAQTPDPSHSSVMETSFIFNPFYAFPSRIKNPTLPFELNNPFGKHYRFPKMFQIAIL